MLRVFRRHRRKGLHDVYIATGSLSVYQVWYNDKKLWTTGGYNLSGILYFVVEPLQETANKRLRTRDSEQETPNNFSKKTSTLILVFF